jgi:hypothetical protein
MLVPRLYRAPAALKLIILDAICIQVAAKGGTFTEAWAKLVKVSAFRNFKQAVAAFDPDSLLAKGGHTPLIPKIPGEGYKNSVDGVSKGSRVSLQGVDAEISQVSTGLCHSTDAYHWAE